MISDGSCETPQEKMGRHRISRLLDSKTPTIRLVLEIFDVCLLTPTLNNEVKYKKFILNKEEYLCDIVTC